MLALAQTQAGVTAVRSGFNSIATFCKSAFLQDFQKNLSINVYTRVYL